MFPPRGLFVISVSDLRKISEKPYDLWAACTLVALTAFRLWYAATHQLIQDEAYYWQWSRHLAWGYYDNTPLLAYVIRVGTTVFGATELGVRAGAVFCGAFTLVFLYLLARRLFGPRVAFFTGLLVNVVPMFGVGTILMTQDPVQILFWAATLFVLSHALSGRPALWYLAGVLAGLAALSKLNALLLLPSVFLYLLLSPTARVRWLRRPEPYLAGVIALVVFSPFVWWNHTHLNAFWLHIGVMGSRSSGHDGLKWFGRFLGDQAVLLSPCIMLTYLYALYDGAKRGIRGNDDPILFLWCPSVVVFTATMCVSLRSKVEGNWAVAAYVSGLILVAVVLIRAWDERGRRGRVWTRLNAGFALALTVIFLFPTLLYQFGLKVHDPTQDRTTELYGWRDLARRLQSEQAAIGPDAFLFSVNYRLPSEAAFYLPGRPKTYSLFLHDRANEYLFWEDPRALVGKDAIFINDSDAPQHIDPKNEEDFRLDDLNAVFERVEAQPSLYIYRDPPYGKTPIRTIQILRCYHFRGYDRRAWQNGW